MAIAKRPGAKKPVLLSKDDKAAEDFITGANKAQQQTETKAKLKPSKKVGIMVYFDPDVLAKVDAHAKRLGLSRSGWLHSTAIRALAED